ncbi:MAG: efflux transporter outer membrane subunit [Puniceicoccaceae bacterium]|nr:MAG: efflux transporter outer membrane subunit [Puniceicoccaceae bacterium]
MSLAAPYRSRPFAFALAILAGLAATACTVGPDYVAPHTESETTADWATPLGSRADSQASAIDLAWWQRFEDPLLTDYIERAIAENPGIEAARARIEGARAARGESRAPWLPSLDAEARRSREGTSGATSNPNNSGNTRSSNSGILSASWELDFFGRTRRAVEAADARLDRAVEDRRTLVLATVAEVARAYHEIRGTQKQIAITQKNVELQTRTVELVENLFASGEASEFDLSRARGQLQVTRARLPDLDAELLAGIYRLGPLLGQAPGTLREEMIQPHSLPSPPELIPIGAPSEILRRRPDIRSAERELAATNADIGVATAELFPRFTLLGNVGRIAASSRDLNSSLADSYGFTQLVDWPIFQGGALRARISLSEAAAQMATANYEATVLAALADAETALVRYLRKLDTRAALADAVENRQRSVELARALFDAGEEDFLAVLDAERELLATENELVLSETNSILNLITLYAALGGGWEVFEASPE